MAGVQVSESFEELKQRGNDSFKEGHFTAAIEWYNRALDVNPNSAIVLSNRSITHLKLENYGFAENDATKAIEIDQTYIKAYYDKEAKQKLQIAQKEFKAIKFAECLSRDNPKKIINPEEIIVNESYRGLHIADEITPEWVLELMRNFKNQVALHKKYAVILIQRVRELLSSYKSLVRITVPSNLEFNICGDVHGQYYDLLNIFELNGNPCENNPYLFNGDFVDRGSFSVEVILTLFAWKLCYPDSFHLTRGNHETRNMNKMYGFEGEVKHKYDPETMELFNQDGVTLADIENIDRIREPPDAGIMCDILWADPIKMNGRHPSKRGVGLCFGPDIAHRFLDENGLDVLVRSHEVKDNGYEEEASGRVITIFSAPNYCDQMNNKGAILKFRGSNMQRRFITFNAVVRII